MNQAWLSVVIPSKNRPEGIRRLLANLNGQDYAADRIEVIVIDDGSEPQYSYADERVRVIRHAKSAGAQKSRNEGMQAANGDIVFICDDDIELIGSDFVSQAMRLFAERDDIVAVIPRKIDVEGEEGSKQELEFSTSRATLYSGDLVRRERKAGPTPWGGGIFFVRRREIVSLGGYDGIYGLNGGHSFREESDVHARLRKQGYLLWYEPEICIKHHIVSSGGHGAHIGRRLYWIAHNHIIFAKRHLAWWPLRAVGFLFDVLRYSWVQGRFRYTLSMLRGYGAGWRNALRDRGPGRNLWLGS